MDLRLRIIRAVESGSSMGGAVQRFAVSPSAAIKQMQPGARGRQRRPRVPSPNRSATAPRPRRKRRCPGFRLHSGSRFINEYDLNAPWRHEVRVEQVPGYLARRHEVVALVPVHGLETPH